MFKNCNNFCSGTHKITFYVGNRCEVEIIAFWSYPWRAVYRYHSTSFEIIVGVTVVLIIILFSWYLYISKIRNDRKHLASDRDRERKVRMQLEKDQKSIPAVPVCGWRYVM